MTVRYEPVGVPVGSGQQILLMGDLLSETQFENWDAAVQWAQDRKWRVGPRRTSADHSETLDTVFGRDHNVVEMRHLTWSMTSPGYLVERND